MYVDGDLVIRPIIKTDLPRLWELIYKEQAPEWKQWDAPYYPHEAMSWENFETKAQQWIDCEEIWVVVNHNKICGTVSYYYEDMQKHWMELGIILHESSNWSKGIGTRALGLWMEHIFKSYPVARVGLTTWSGNKRMIRVAEKLNMKMEGRIRKVRFYKGKYYDSIRMGILREEWVNARRTVIHGTTSSGNNNDAAD